MVAVGMHPSLAWLCQSWFGFADRCWQTAVTAIADMLVSYGCCLASCSWYTAIAYTGVIVTFTTLITPDSRWSLLIYSYCRHGCVMAAAASPVAVGIKPPLVRLCG